MAGTVRGTATLLEALARGGQVGVSMRRVLAEERRTRVLEKSLENQERARQFNQAIRGREDQRNQQTHDARMEQIDRNEWNAELAAEFKAATQGGPEALQTLGDKLRTVLPELDPNSHRARRVESQIRIVEYAQNPLYMLSNEQRSQVSFAEFVTNTPEGRNLRPVFGLKTDLQTNKFIYDQATQWWEIKVLMARELRTKMMDPLNPWTEEQLASIGLKPEDIYPPTPEEYMKYIETLNKRFGGTLTLMQLFGGEKPQVPSEEKKDRIKGKERKAPEKAKAPEKTDAAEKLEKRFPKLMSPDESLEKRRRILRGLPGL